MTSQKLSPGRLAEQADSDPWVIPGLKVELLHMWMFAVLLASLQGPSLPVHTWIADLKASPGTLAGREVLVEGDVVDIRTTSPTSRRGMYRVIDASDRTGVLVRSEHLPVDGGSFRVRARVTADSGAQAPLLLEELERDRTDARPLAPVLATVLSGVLFLLVAVLLGQLLRAERRHMVEPPLWLLPTAGPYGKVGNGAPQAATLKYEPEFEEADRRKREQFRRRKRSLIVALIGSLVVTGTSAAWVLDTRTSAPQVPAFILVDAADGMPVRNPAPATDSALRDQAATVPIDSAAPPRGPTRIARVDSTPSRRAPGPTIAKPSSTAVSAPADPIVTNPTPVPTPPPPPAPAPAPAPTPAPPPEPVRRNPEEERVRAENVLQEAVSGILSAINAKASSRLAALVPEGMADDPSRRERFMKLVRESAPKATGGAVTDRTFAEERAEARFTVTLVWRGDFGVERRKTGRFLVVARRQEAGWQFEGARLLDALP